MKPKLKENGTSVIIGPVRFSYANVFEPKGIDGGEPKYSCSILVPKDDKETIAVLEEAIENAIAGGSSKVGTKPNRKTLKTPLRDGDDERPDDEAYAGHMFFNASSKNRPAVVGRMRQELNEEEFFSGDYGNVSVNFYAFAVSGNKGIAAGLNNIQKTQDGERLAGGPSAQDEFEDLDNEDDVLDM